MHLTNSQIKLFHQNPEEYVLNNMSHEIKWQQEQYNRSKEDAIKFVISQVRDAIL